MEVVDTSRPQLSSVPTVVPASVVALRSQAADVCEVLETCQASNAGGTEADDKARCTTLSPELSAGQLSIIGPQRGWQVVDLAELYAYRDLYRFLVRREIKVRYAQSAIGVGWAILQPLFAMLIFTVVFGRLARVTSDGVPYALFSFAGLIPWMYFSNSVTDGVGSLIGNVHMLSKVYFPRLLLPLAAVTARAVDFAVASVLLCGMLVWYRTVPNWGLVVLPWILSLMLLTALASALWLGAMAIQYRDIKHAMAFIVQILMYAAPVVYPISLVPERYQLLVALNPMVGVIEALRSALFGTTPMPWWLLCVGTLSALLMLFSGLMYFNQKQRSFADVA